MSNHRKKEFSLEELTRFLNHVSGSVELVVSIQKTGNFEVSEGGTAIVTGRAYVPQNVAKEMTSVELKTSEDFPMSTKDIYKELRLRGYNYKGLFRSLVGANPQGKQSAR